MPTPLRAGQVMMWNGSLWLNAEPGELFTTYTVAELPSAADYSGTVVCVSNGDYGNPCLARSDGSNWHVLGSRWGVVATTVPTVTIASGAITVTTDEARVDTEGAAATDDLDTVTGVPGGKTLILRPADNARTVVLKDGSGNLNIKGDFALDHTEDKVSLRSSSNGATLTELSRSDNNTTVETLTIASGVATAVGTGPGSVELYLIDTEAAAASDDLDTLDGIPARTIVVLRAANSSRTVVVKDGTGNLKLSADFSLDNVEDTITLVSNGTNLYELCRSDNGA